MAITNKYSHFGQGAVPSWMSTSVAASGTVAVSSGVLHFSTPAGDDAAIVWLNERPVKNENQMYRFRVRMNAFTAQQGVTLITKTTDPACETNANFSPRLVARISVGTFGTQQIEFSYWDGAGVKTDWNGAAWAAGGSGSGAAYTTGDWFEGVIEIDGDNQRFRMAAFSSSPFDQANAGLRLVALSDWVLFSAVRGNGDDLWFTTGDPLTGGLGTLDMDIAMIRRNAGTVQVAATNNRQGSGNQYVIVINRSPGTQDWDDDATGTAGLQAIRLDRTTAAVGPGGAGSWDELGPRDKSLRIASSNGTYYMVYMGTAAGGASAVGIASSATPLTAGAWTKYASNPIISAGPNGGSLSQPRMYEFPNGYQNDPNKRWLLLVTELTLGPTRQRIHAYYTSSATPNTTAWTYMGQVLDVGSGGSWDDQQVANAVAHFYQNGSIAMLYSGFQAGQVKWGYGIAIGPSILALTKDAGNPYIAGQSGPSTTITGAHVAQQTMVVASTTGFAEDMVIVATDDNVSDSGMLNRVRKVTDATHLELYHQFTIGVNGVVRGLDGNRITSEEIFEVPGKGFLIYSTPFGFWNDDASYEAYFENSGALKAASLGGGVPHTWLWPQNPAIHHDAFGSSLRGAENPTWARGPYYIGGDELGVGVEHLPRHRRRHHK